MESTTLFAALLPLLVVAVIVFLYLRAETTLHRQSAETAKLIEQTVTLALTNAEQHRDAIEAVMERTADQHARMLDEMATRFEEQTRATLEAMTTTQRSMDLMLTKALTGSNEQTKQVTALVNSSLALLGTDNSRDFRDAVAYTSPPEEGLEPYPGVDEAEEQRLAEEAARSRRAQLGELDSAIALLEQMGVPGGGAES